MPDFESLALEEYCYLTTVGRVTGKTHTIEIWFAQRDATIYMLAGRGESADWVRNIRATPEVVMRIADRNIVGHGRIVVEPEEDETARALVFDKYRSRHEGDLDEWRETALPVAVDLSLGAP